ncbi:MAG: hypothetical protein LBN99_08320, partial [Oscillospiraceae bacterium]|nr:hypothetical protein [Oscillospiraceae bacterium]
MNIKRTIAGILTAAALFGALSGCGKKEGSPDAEPDVPFENVYTETAVPIELGDNSDGFAYANGRIYYNTREEREPIYGTVEGSPEKGLRVVVSKIMSCDMDGGDVRTEWEDDGTAEPDPNEPVSELVMLQQFGVDNAGNIWITVNYVHMDNTDAQNPIYEST